MRKLVLLLLAGSFVLAGCHHKIGNGIIGSGKRAVQKREVSPFTSISLEGAFEVQIVCQQPLNLEVEGDDNILPVITTEVSNNVLHVKSSRDYSVRDSIALRIAVPSLDGLNVSGAGKIDITGMKNDRFEIDSSGAPVINVAGTTKVVDIDTSGAARIDAHKLHASRAVIDTKGASKVDVDVIDQLDVTISGPSRVTYEGDPTVNKTIRGPGKLERKMSEGAWRWNEISISVM